MTTSPSAMPMSDRRKSINLRSPALSTLWAIGFSCYPGDSSAHGVEQFAFATAVVAAVVGIVAGLVSGWFRWSAIRTIPIAIALLLALMFLLSPKETAIDWSALIGGLLVTGLIGAIPLAVAFAIGRYCIAAVRWIIHGGRSGA